MSDLLSLINAVRRHPRERVPVRMLADHIYGLGGLTWVRACRNAAGVRRECITTAELTQAARCIRPGATYRAEIFRAVELYLLGHTSATIRVYIVPGSRAPELVARESHPTLWTAWPPNARVGARWILAWKARFMKARREATRKRMRHLRGG